MMKKATLGLLAKHLNSASQVIVRADLSVPIKKGNIQDLIKIKSTIPTLTELLKHNPKSIVLLSHLGKPNGQKNNKFSLKQIVPPLEQLLGRQVTFLDDCIGDKIVNQVNNSKGQVFLCENLSFHHEEQGATLGIDKKKNISRPDEIAAFRRQLSRLGNVYVNDCFGSTHLQHSSIVGIKAPIRVAGLLMQKQIQFLSKFLTAPRKPVLVILGGQTLNSQVELVLNMLKFADEIIIGGGMSNPFIRHIHGHKLGSTLDDMNDSSAIQHIINKANEKGVKIHLPIDGVCAKSVSSTDPPVICDNKDVKQGWQIFDKGPKSIQQFDKVIQRANSIFWNGQIGVLQFPNFQQGSQGILKSIIKRTKEGAVSIISGGGPTKLINTKGNYNDVSFVSSGGATLNFMQGIKLPGIDHLSEVSQIK